MRELNPTVSTYLLEQTMPPSYCFVVCHCISNSTTSLLGKHATKETQVRSLRCLGWPNRLSGLLFFGQSWGYVSRPGFGPDFRPVQRIANSPFWPRSPLRKTWFPAAPRVTRTSAGVSKVAANFPTSCELALNVKGKGKKRRHGHSVTGNRTPV
jgi:hypothetical protein